MAKEICISSTPHETRLAILEDDQLAEIYYERENEYTLAGSIYNGRVTRVLPGMQSAFVDVGLERDAFLYVTDFLELEDPEEADELEKAATTGSTQAPREVRNSPARSEGRNEDNGQRPGQKEGRSERGGPDRSNQDRSNQDRSSQDRSSQDRSSQDRNNQDRPRRMVVEAATDDALPETASSAGSISLSPEGSEEDGPSAKRWRGRRRRRGGRGDAAPPQAQSGSEETFSEETSEESTEFNVDQQTQAGPASSDRPLRPSRSERPNHSEGFAAPAEVPATGGSQLPTPFVLPGESLRKYGGTSELEAPKAAPPRPASTFKPATLVEAPLAWDGSGLLPGESISRHRRPEPEPATDPRLHGPFSDAASAPDEVEGEHFIAEQTEAPQPAVSSPSSVSTSGYAVEEIWEETNEEVLPHSIGTEGNQTEELSSDRLVESLSLPEEAEAQEAESETPDASASHHVDPSTPTGFRLFGLGGKKKAEVPSPVLPAPAPPAPAPAAPVTSSATTVATAPAYAPGAGHFEEELIEEEEFDAPHHHSKSEDHDLEDYEEETLPVQLGTGDLGEMLQEAHLDHKIQLNFDDKNVEEESFDDEDDEEEQATGDGQPASGQGPNSSPDSSQQRRDRGGRGRRGGRPPQGSQPGGQGNRRGGGMTRRAAQTSDLPIISDLLKPGQEILVQIAKEPIAKKGARITSHIALPGRFLVFMPTVSHIGVSRKIASDEERQRLKRILVHERGEASGGFIVRTAAEGASEEELRADLRFLIHLWNEIKTRSDSSKSPALIYHDLSLIERILRDQVSSNFSSIWVDSQDDYERIVRFLNRFSPSLVRRVKLYSKEIPLFEHFGIQDEISKALRSKVWLKSGGSIVINQTEALVAIDINTGKYVGKSARLEDTIVKTNLDAVPEIVRQIRLRDLGGIIVIDFIDMDERKNRFKVLAALEEALKADRAPTKVLQFNDFGLVAITRKRVKQSLERTLSVPCPTCQATGMVKSPTTVCNEIYTELRKMKKHFENADVLLRVNPETVKVLKQNNAAWLTEFEELLAKNILVKSDATLHPEQFDIQG
jgi:Rne/Rng family ribonuclease